MISATVRRLGAFGYRFAFLAGGLYLVWRGMTDISGARTLTGLGLGGLCLFKFGLLLVIDYRRGLHARR